MSARRSRPAWAILVAGAGLPGLAVALALARRLGPAVRVEVCDPAVVAPGQFDGRAYALSPASRRFLDGLGVWSSVTARAQPIRAMLITDGRAGEPVRPPFLRFGDVATGAAADGDPLGHMVEGDGLGSALIAACREAGIGFVPVGIAAVDSRPEHAAVRLGDGTARDAALVVAADGARSRLREAAGIGWVSRPYGQAGVVATVRHARPHDGVAVQHFLPAGPFAMLPLVDGPDLDGPARHRSSIVWTLDLPGARRLAALGPAEASEALADAFGGSLGRVTPETPLRPFPLAFGLARRFAAGRVALLGDAAHEIHPLAGQGLNLGLADADALADRAAEAVRLGLDPGGPDPLARYERDRRFDALLLAATTDGLNRLFSNDRPLVRLARELGLAAVDRMPALKAAFADRAAGR